MASSTRTVENVVISRTNLETYYDVVLMGNGSGVADGGRIAPTLLGSTGIYFKVDVASKSDNDGDSEPQRLYIGGNYNDGYGNIYASQWLTNITTPLGLNHAAGAFFEENGEVYLLSQAGIAGNDPSVNQDRNLSVTAVGAYQMPSISTDGVYSMGFVALKDLTVKGNLTGTIKASTGLMLVETASSHASSKLVSAVGLVAGDTAYTPAGALPSDPSATAAAGHLTRDIVGEWHGVKKSMTAGSTAGTLKIENNFNGVVNASAEQTLIHSIASTANAAIEAVGMEATGNILSTGGYWTGTVNASASNNSFITAFNDSTAKAETSDWAFGGSKYQEILKGEIAGHTAAKKSPSANEYSKEALTTAVTPSSVPETADATKANKENFSNLTATLSGKGTADDNVLYITGCSETNANGAYVWKYNSWRRYLSDGTYYLATMNAGSYSVQHYTSKESESAVGTRGSTYELATGTGVITLSDLADGAVNGTYTFTGVSGLESYYVKYDAGSTQNGYLITRTDDGAGTGTYTCIRFEGLFPTHIDITSATVDHVNEAPTLNISSCTTTAANGSYTLQLVNGSYLLVKGYSTTAGATWYTATMNRGLTAVTNANVTDLGGTITGTVTVNKDKNWSEIIKKDQDDLEVVVEGADPCDAGTIYVMKKGETGISSVDKTTIKTTRTVKSYAYVGLRKMTQESNTSAFTDNNISATGVSAWNDLTINDMRSYLDPLAAALTPADTATVNVKANENRFISKQVAAEAGLVMIGLTVTTQNQKTDFSNPPQSGKYNNTDVKYWDFNKNESYYVADGAASIGYYSFTLDDLDNLFLLSTKTDAQIAASGITFSAGGTDFTPQTQKEVQLILDAVCAAKSTVEADLKATGKSSETTDASLVDNNVITSIGLAARNINLGDVGKADHDAGVKNVSINVKANDNLFEKELTCSNDYFNKNNLASHVYFHNNQILAKGIDAANILTMGYFDADITVQMNNNTLQYSRDIDGDGEMETEYLLHATPGEVDTLNLLAGGIEAKKIVVNEYLGGTITLDLADNFCTKIDAFGIRAESITVKGAFATNITVLNPAVDGNLTHDWTQIGNTYGIRTSWLTADSFSGTITGNGQLTAGIYIVADDILNNSTAWLLQGNEDHACGITTSGKNSPFVISGTITGTQFAFLQNSAINISITGTIETTGIDFESEYGFAVIGAYQPANDYVELGSGASVKGSISLYSGTNTVVLHSESTLIGDIDVTGERLEISSNGTNNITFVLEGRKADDSAIITVQTTADASFFGSSTFSLNMNGLAALAKDASAEYVLYDYSALDAASLAAVQGYWNSATNYVNLIYQGVTDGSITKAKLMAGVTNYNGYDLQLSWNGAKLVLTATNKNDSSAVPLFSSGKVETATTQNASADNQVLLSWSATSNTRVTNPADSTDLYSGYELQYTVTWKDADGTDHTNTVNSTVSGSTKSYALTLLEGQTLTKWSVRWFTDHGNNVSQWVPVTSNFKIKDSSTTTIDLVNLDDVELSASDPVNLTSGIISAVAKLSWNRQNDAKYTLDHYELDYIVVEKALTHNEIQAGFAGGSYHTKTMSSTDAILSGLPTGCYVYWRLKVYDTAGKNAYYYSANDGTYSDGSAKYSVSSFRVFERDLTAPAVNGKVKVVGGSVTNQESNKPQISELKFAWHTAADAQSGVHYYLIEVMKKGAEDWTTATQYKVYVQDAVASSGYEYSRSVTFAECDLYQYRFSAVDYAGNRSYYEIDGLDSNVGEVGMEWNPDTEVPLAAAGNGFGNLIGGLSGTPNWIDEKVETTTDEDTGLTTSTRIPGHWENTQVSVSWNDGFYDNSGELRYVVEFMDQNTGALLTTLSTEYMAAVKDSVSYTTHTLTLDNSSTGYTTSYFAGHENIAWRVYAIDRKGNKSAVSGETSFQFVGTKGTGTNAETVVITDENGPYTAASNLSMTPDLTTNTGTFTWTNAEDDFGIANYELVLRNQATGAVYSIGGIKGTTYEMAVGKVPEGRYSWTVNAYDGTGKSISSETVDILVDFTAPYWVNGTGFKTYTTYTYSAKDTAEPTKVYGTFTWNKASDSYGVDHYELVISQKKVNEDGTVDEVEFDRKSLTGTSYTVKMVLGTEYTTKLYVYDKAGNKTEYNGGDFNLFSGAATMHMDRNSDDFKNSTIINAKSFETEIVGGTKYIDAAWTNSTDQTVGKGTTDYYAMVLSGKTVTDKFDKTTWGTTLTFTVKDLYAISGTNSGINITVYSYDNNKALKSFAVTKAGTYKLNLDTQENHQYYFAVSSRNSSAIIYYDMDLKAAYNTVDTLDNDWTKIQYGAATKFGDYKVDVPALADGHIIQDLVSSSSDSAWVGYKDGVSIRQLNLARSSGTYNFTVGNVSANAVLTVYGYKNGGTKSDVYKKLKSITVKGTSGTAMIKDLVLNQDYDFIYVEVKASGSESTSYSLDVTGETYDAYIQTHKAKTSVVDPGNYSEGKTVDPIAKRGDTSALLETNWVGTADNQNWEEFKVSADGVYNFQISGLEGNVTFTVWELQVDADNNPKRDKNGNPILKAIKKVAGSYKISGNQFINSLTTGDLVLDSSKTYYLSVEAAKNKNSMYRVDVIKAETVVGRTTTPIDISNTEVNKTTDYSNIGWVGYSKNDSSVVIQQYNLEVTDAGFYSFTVDGVLNAAKLTVKDAATGKVMKTLTVTPKRDKYGNWILTGTIANLLLNNGNYTLEVSAVNGAKNKNTDFKFIAQETESFTHDLDAADFSWNPEKSKETISVVSHGAGTSGGWVGFGNATDTFNLSITDSEKGLYAFTLNGASAAMKLVIKNSLGKAIKTITVSASVGNNSTGFFELLAGNYTVEITATGAAKGQNTAYQLDVTRDLYDNANEDPDPIELTAGSVKTGWVGTGDTEDIYYIGEDSTVNAGNYDIRLEGLTSAVKITVYSMNPATKKKTVYKTISATPRYDAKTNTWTYVTIDTNDLYLAQNTQYYISVTAVGSTVKTGTSYSIKYEFVEDQADDLANGSISALKALIEAGSVTTVAVTASTPEITTAASILEVDSSSQIYVTRVEDGTNTAKTDWVGKSDTTDFFAVSLSSKGNYNFTLSTDVANSFDLTAALKLSIYNADGKLLKYVTVTPKYDTKTGAWITETGGINGYIMNAGTYYVSVSGVKATSGAETSYQLYITGDQFFKANAADNTYKTATSVSLNSIVDHFLAKNEWVGYGDAIDYYSFSVTTNGSLKESGVYTLTLDSLEQNYGEVQLIVYRKVVDANGNEKSPVQIGAFTYNKNSKTGAVTDRIDMTLLDGSYYVAVKSTDNGAGKKNASYSVEIQQSTPYEVLGVTAELGQTEVNTVCKVDFSKLTDSRDLNSNDVWTAAFHTGTDCTFVDLSDFTGNPGDVTMTLFKNVNNKLTAVAIDNLSLMNLTSDTTYYLQIKNNSAVDYKFAWNDTDKALKFSAVALA